jgi:hypothetical protein
MTWIRTIPASQAKESLQESYRRIYALFPSEYERDVPAVTRPDGTADSIVASHSLLPDVMEPIFEAFGRLLSSDLPLSRRQHEMITTLVSSLNRCRY